ncbi:DUF898 family protein [Devosia sp. BSSL-BM10]|uniref:DUF898 family protein n=1 Tax=Devosia litorisediminis TaxID=2829817 RepID=A0A942EBF1_9HYPH|nr:DUF898 family protein [Devosia litorisediminis]MBS3849284.1 DUF898 family protein [Devosia litorisediminis]
MVMQQGPGRPVPVVFTGTRRELGGLLLRGYLLLLPTIGLYRFWLLTWKRRFYWSNTEIDGDSLEYTGNAMQLLLGFLMALAVFLPFYVVFFYLSTLSTDAAIIGYGGIGVALWFLMGYAIYRARDFRFSRTLWRGIRFDQTGNGWAYALRRFGWSLLMIVTAGLVYPFMAASLWRYRYGHSWYGDLRFGFVGSWKQLAAQYYLTYVAVVIIGAIAAGVGLAMDVVPAGGEFNPLGLVPLGIGALLIALLALRYQARELSRMYSSVRLGSAVVTVTVTGRALFGQYVLCGLALLGAFVLLAIGGFVVLGLVANEAFAGGFDPEIFFRYMQGSLVTLIAIIFGYLLILGAFTMMTELFIGLGYWNLIASGASIAGADSLRGVRARSEDKALAGEGLADALNVGAY